mgnify:CR=1 FL=1
MPNTISLKNISFKSNNKIILNKISLTISTNKITVITGHNGAGKTSLLKIMGNIIVPTHGSVTYGDITDLNKTAFSFQEPVFLNRTVASNLEHALICYNGYYTQKYKSLIQGILSEFNIMRLSNMIASKLSTGEKKIISYIRCIILNPKILFLDEPYAHLDQKYVDLISNHIKSISDKINIFIVTHSNNNLDDLPCNVIKMQQGNVE